MRYSRPMLILKYLNREQYFGALLPLVFFGTLATIAMLLYFATDFQLLMRGKTTQAILREKFIALNPVPPRAIAGNLLAHGGGRRRHGPRNQFRYDYIVNGKLFTGTSPVAPRDWEQAAVGKPLTVLYRADQPEQQRLGGWWELLPSLSWGLIPMLLAVACWTMAYFSLRAGIRNLRRQVDLVCDGTAALAIVDAYEIKHGRKGRSFVDRFAYTYLIDDEEHQQRLEKVEAGTDVPFRPVTAGDVLLVLYDPRDPARHTIDRFNARPEDKQRLEEMAAKRSACAALDCH